MNETSINQLCSFFIFVGIGMLISLIFDIFRVFRKSFSTSDTITFIEDIVFWIIAGIILFYTIFTFNKGELRLYIFIAMVIGGAIYISTISKTFIKVNSFIIKFVKKIIVNTFNILILPYKFLFKFIRKIFFKPISFFFINFKGKITNIEKKNTKFSRKRKFKKDFSI